MSEERKGWLNLATIVPMIPTTVLAAIAIFWFSQGIVTEESLGVTKDDFKSDLALIRDDFKGDLDLIRDDFNRRFDKLDRDFEYIRNNMVTKADIQQIQVDIARNRQRLDEHLTLHHNSSEP